jgi:glycosyltransferase involved in cell wall biosynthesis
MDDVMSVSIIVCTYRRADELEHLLRCLTRQTHRSFEVLVVDGSGADPIVRERVAAISVQESDRLPLRLITAPTGLTKQRNIGLAEARGDLIAFLDDDVSIGPTFLADVVRRFRQPGLEDVGGITGFDTAYYPQPITLIWRMRYWFGVIPGLTPGVVDHLGRRAPLDFAGRMPLQQPVGWLPGFCMIYRREAVRSRSFDESLPTYAGEDRTFSMDVGSEWRLLLCADITLEHHRSAVARDDDVSSLFQNGFGMGRGFARRARTALDWGRIAQYALGETTVQFLRFLHRPGRDRLRGVIAFPRGMVSGLLSAGTPLVRPRR